MAPNLDPSSSFRIHPVPEAGPSHRSTPYEDGTRTSRDHNPRDTDSADNFRAPPEGRVSPPAPQSTAPRSPRSTRRYRSPSPYYGRLSPQERRERDTGDRYDRHRYERRSPSPSYYRYRRRSPGPSRYRSRSPHHPTRSPTHNHREDSLERRGRSRYSPERRYSRRQDRYRDDSYEDRDRHRGRAVSPRTPPRRIVSSPPREPTPSPVLSREQTAGKIREVLAVRKARETQQKWTRNREAVQTGLPTETRQSSDESEAAASENGKKKKKKETTKGKEKPVVERDKPARQYTVRSKAEAEAVLQTAINEDLISVFALRPNPGLTPSVIIAMATGFRAQTDHLNGLCNVVSAFRENERAVVAAAAELGRRTKDSDDTSREAFQRHLHFRKRLKQDMDAALDISGEIAEEVDTIAQRLSKKRLVEGAAAARKAAKESEDI